MIKKLLNGESKTITGAAIIIAVTSLTSRFLGIIRDRILAGQFGAGDTLDAYYAAFRIPDLVYNLLVLGALSAGFIPVFTALIEKNKNEGWQLANRVLNILIVALAILCGIFAIFTPQLMRWITPGFNGEKLDITINLTRIMFLSPLILGVSSLFGGILQSFKRFLVFSLAPIFYNLGIIFGALVLVNFFGVYGLAYGVIIGALLHLLVQIPTSIYLGWRPQFLWDFNKDLKKVFTMMVPRTIGLAVSQLNLVVITIIATLLSAGSLAVFNLANNLQYFPIGIFGISFAIAAFPTLSALAIKENKNDFVESFSNTTRQILFFIIPASALFLILRAQIVRVILGSGAFTWEDTILTADCLAMFSISLFAQSLTPLLIRGFYALHNAITPFLISLFCAILNIALSLYFTGTWFFSGSGLNLGVAGLALAFSIAQILNFAILWVFLKFKIGSLDEKRIIWAVFKISIATLIMGIVTQFMKFGIEPFFGTSTFLGIFAQGLIAGLVGIAVFIIVGLVLRSAEMFTFVDAIKRRLFKNKAVVGKEGLEEL